MVRKEGFSNLGLRFVLSLLAVLDTELVVVVLISLDQTLEKRLVSLDILRKQVLRARVLRPQRLLGCLCVVEHSIQIVDQTHFFNILR